MIATLKSLLIPFFARFGYEFKRIKPQTSSNIVLELLLKDKTDIRFVQIGANDGRTVDPLYPLVKPSWSGVLVEPNPVAFEKLCDNYRNDKRQNMQFINAAITDKDGTCKIYCPNDASESVKSSVIKSVAKISVCKTKTELIACDVRSMTLAALFAQCSIKELELLLVDTEGCDGGIMEQLISSDVRPSIIQFEHAFIDAKQIQFIYSNLEKIGYKLLAVENDTIAVRG